MTSVYPSQPTPSFLQKYTKNIYNRVHYNHAHHDGHQNMDEAAIDLQVSPYGPFSVEVKVKKKRVI